MSNYPIQPGSPQAYYYQPPPTNALGIAGFVVSLSGMVVCLGLICPIGLILSLIALAKAPRGYAIAGCIVGVLGSILGVLTVLVVSGTIGNGLFNLNYYGQSQTSYTLDMASNDIDIHFNNNQDTLPDEPAGNAMIASYTDEWGNSLKYLPTPGSIQDYTITSAGPDGLHGTGDDMTQFYTAYSWANPQVQASPIDEIDDQDIDAAFNFAAKKIVQAFPPDTALPTQALVDLTVDELVDAWLTPMKYTPTDNPPWYHLKSAGPDKAWGTGDDLTRSFYFSPTGEADSPQ